jgi:hypothetical protein
VTPRPLFRLTSLTLSQNLCSCTVLAFLLPPMTDPLSSGNGSLSQPRWRGQTAFLANLSSCKYTFGVLCNGMLHRLAGPPVVSVLIKPWCVEVWFARILRDFHFPVCFHSRQFDRFDHDDRGSRAQRCESSSPRRKILHSGGSGRRYIQLLHQMSYKCFDPALKSSIYRVVGSVSLSAYHFLLPFVCNLFAMEIRRIHDIGVT